MKLIWIGKEMSRLNDYFTGFQQIQTVLASVKKSIISSVSEMQASNDDSSIKVTT